MLPRAPQRRGRPVTRVAIVVGVGDYPEPDDRLAFCAGDAIAVAEVLATPEFGFETLTLLDADATLQNIQDLLRVAFEEWPAAETLLFYFAGHSCETAFENFLVT
jgi:metacaspase-1